MSILIESDLRAAPGAKSVSALGYCNWQERLIAGEKLSGSRCVYVAVVYGLTFAVHACCVADCSANVSYGTMSSFLLTCSDIVRPRSMCRPGMMK